MSTIIRNLYNNFWLWFRAVCSNFNRNKSTFTSYYHTFSYLHCSHEIWTYKKCLYVCKNLLIF